MSKNDKQVMPENLTKTSTNKKEYQAIYQKNRKKKMKELGLCLQSCGRPARPKMTRCEECMTKAAAGQRLHLQKRKAAGQCYTCSSPAEPPYVNCIPCKGAIAWYASQRDSLRGGYTPISLSKSDFVKWYTDHVRTVSCEWCGGPFGEKGPIVEHSHVTGEVRGIVCNPCNVAEGCGIDRLRKIVARFST